MLKQTMNQETENTGIDVSTTKKWRERSIEWSNFCKNSGSISAEELDLLPSWNGFQGFEFSTDGRSISLSQLEMNVNEAQANFQNQNEESQETAEAKLALVEAELAKEKAERALVEAKLAKEKAERVLSEAKLAIEALFIEILHKHENTRASLSILQSLGNQTETKTITQTEHQAEVVDPTRVSTELVPSPSTIVQKTEPGDDVDLLNGLIRLVGRKQMVQVEAFRKFLVGLQKKSFDYFGDEGHDVNVEHTVQAIQHWDMNSSLSEEKDFYAWAPENLNYETKVDHPIIHAICATLIQLLETGETLTNEQDVQRLDAVAKGRQKRRVDIMRHRTRERLSCLFPAQIESCTEVKAISANLQKAVNQCLGHLGRRAAFSFDFAGVGEDFKNYAVAISLKKIAVVCLELSHVGTSKVELNTSKTKEMDFIGKSNSGLLLLLGALKATVLSVGSDVLQHGDSKLTAQTLDGKLKTDVTRYLGSGTFSHAVSVQGGSDTLFMKIPVAAALTPSLRSELTTLQALKGGVQGEEFWSIPEVYGDDLHKFLFSSRGQIGRLQGLVLSGIIGKTLSVAVQETEGEKERATLVKAVHDESLKAIKFAHERKKAHMDLRGGNVIVKLIGDKWHVMIADWGSSSTLGEKNKFRGTPAYAHNSWFPDAGKKKKIVPAFDHAGLGYTIVTALGGAAWKNRFIDTKKIKSSEKEARTVCCKEILEEHKFVLDDSIQRAMGLNHQKRGSAAAAPAAHAAQQPKNKPKRKRKTSSNPSWTKRPRREVADYK